MFHKQRAGRNPSRRMADSAMHIQRNALRVLLGAAKLAIVLLGKCFAVD